jgi:hypothetical protein
MKSINKIISEMNNTYRRKGMDEYPSEAIQKLKQDWSTYMPREWNILDINQS